mgnify:CR=1 FL=1
MLDILTSGKSIEYTFAVPEGLNRFEIAKIYGQLGLGTQEEFLALTESPAFIQELLGENLPSLEGYLFPETYRITRFTNARETIRLMVQQCLRQYQEAKQGSNIVASVFHNRLRQKMPLQTDPTILYGLLMERGEWVLNIKKEDIRRPTPYNTYTFVGLPVGPIANPGRESLLAALHPEQTEFIFFVSKNDGTTQFSRTLREHNRAVAEFQKDARARHGKSWRQFKKKKK